jgi:zinc protease
MLDRTVAPPVQPLASVTLPAADVFLLPNGARLHILRNDAQPVVRLQIVVKAGKWTEPAPGVSLLTARMLLEGTHTRTARQIADEVAFYGASLECEQGFDRATLTLYCLTRHLATLLPLVVDVLTSPTFPETELTLLKTRTIQNVRVERQKTSYLAAEQFSADLFGAAHPYGQKFNEDSFQQITSRQLHDFHQSAYQLSSAELFLCGDISPADEQLLHQSIGSIHQPAPVSLQLETVATVPTVHTTYVPVEGSLQASLRIGRHWPALTDAHAHQLQVLVKVLGGYFGSRLMKNIREDKGLTYGIYASIGPREHATSFVIGSDVNGASAEAAVQEIHHELHRLQEDLIPEAELITVKNYMAGKFANEISTVFEQCDKYKNLIFLNLPLSHYTDFLTNIRSVDAETLRQLAQQYLAPSAMTQVIAGPLPK